MGGGEKVYFHQDTRKGLSKKLHLSRVLNEVSRMGDMIITYTTSKQTLKITESQKISSRFHLEIYSVAIPALDYIYFLKIQGFLITVIPTLLEFSSYENIYAVSSTPKNMAWTT